METVNVPTNERKWHKNTKSAAKQVSGILKVACQESIKRANDMIAGGTDSMCSSSSSELSISIS